LCGDEKKNRQQRGGLSAAEFDRWHVFHESLLKYSSTAADRDQIFSRVDKSSELEQHPYRIASCPE